MRSRLSCSRVTGRTIRRKRNAFASDATKGSAISAICRNRSVAVSRAISRSTVEHQAVHHADEALHLDPIAVQKLAASWLASGLEDGEGERLDDVAPSPLHVL